VLTLRGPLAARSAAQIPRANGVQQQDVDRINPAPTQFTNKKMRFRHLLLYLHPSDGSPPLALESTGYGYRKSHPLRSRLNAVDAVRQRAVR
jgi:hypothetical protein